MHYSFATRKSLAKRADEKTKSERYDPVRIIKYTDADQRRNTEKKDVNDINRDTARGEKRVKRMQESTRPPSKPLAGRRFIKAKNKEAIINNLQSKGRGRA